jgi:hypothetical protein
VGEIELTLGILLTPKEKRKTREKKEKRAKRG